MQTVRVVQNHLDSPVHRRHQQSNIPTEIVRTLVAIAETGSFSKAAEKLGLSQPAISAQVKRLQILVGGPVFERVSGRVVFTPRGNLVLVHARKLLEANDQIICLGGSAQDSQPIRLGLSTLYVEPFMERWNRTGNKLPINFYCDTSSELVKGLIDGYLDIACLFAPSPDLELTVKWQEEFVWVRSSSFVVSPGSPIPLVLWPGAVSDLPMTKALEKAGLAYRVVFAGGDHHARVAAVTTGIGIMALPRRQVPAPLQVATEYYLPRLEPFTAGIVVRSSLNAAAAAPLLQLLRNLAPPLESQVA